MPQIFANRQYVNPGIVPWAFMLISVLVLASLGLWQMQRLAWKEALLERIEVGQELMPLMQLPSDAAGLEEALYRRVKVSYPLKREQYFLRAGVHRDWGKGYYVLSIMELGQGNYILVNRGFAAGETEAVKEALAAEELTDPTTVEGILRPAYAPRLFSPSDHPDINIWFSEDVGKMASYLPTSADEGTVSLLPIVLEATSEQPMKGTPVTTPNNNKPRMRNDHLGYAVTWFGLALTGVIMFYFFCYRRKES